MKKGDHVRITDKCYDPSWVGKTGVITDNQPRATYPFLVREDGVPAATTMELGPFKAEELQVIDN